MTRRFFLAAAFGLALCASAHAQDYPARPIRIIVPYPAGGSADLMPRVFAEVAYRAEPDGYTLFATAPGPLIVNQNLYGKLPFDPAQFVPVAIMGAIPNVLLVNPKLPA